MSNEYTSKQVRAALRAHGLSVTEWAKQHGFPVQAVYSALSGKTQGCRGMAHEIALALRLKEPPGPDMNWLVEHDTQGARVNTQPDSPPSMQQEAA